MRPALILLASCAGTPPPSGQDKDSASETVIPAPEDDTAETGPQDRDGDGHDATTDCNDTDPEVNPDAPEVWNAKDDDCDGRSDGDGDYRGNLTMDASAIYEGQPYSFTLGCTGALERAGAYFNLVVSCPTDETDAMERLLLGASVVLVIEESVDAREAAFEQWQGRATLRSSDGWDTWVDTTMAWSDFTSVAIVGDRTAPSLSVSLSGGLSWVEPTD